MSLIEKILHDILGLKVKSDESSHSGESEDEELKTSYFDIPDIVKDDIIKTIDLYRKVKVHKWKKKPDNSDMQSTKELEQLDSTCCLRYTKELLQLENEMFESIETKCISIVEANCKILLVDKDKKFVTCMICNIAISVNEFFMCYEHLRSEAHITKLKKLNQNKDLVKLAEQFMVNKTKICLTCKSCGTVVDIKNKTMHIDSFKHISKSTKCIENTRNYIDELKKMLNNALYNVQYYACLQCMKKFYLKIKFLYHLNMHKYNTETETNTFNFCVTCAMLWYDKKDTYALHSTHLIHSYLLESKHFAVGCMPEQAKNLLQSSDEIVEKLVNEICDVEVNMKMISEVKKSLSTILKPSFPQLEMYPFGSRIYGLGFKNSDIDIYVDCENRNYKGAKDETSIKYLRKCEEVFKDNNESWEIKRIITDTRMPIVTVVHTKTGLYCDLSFSSGLSVESTYLLREYCKQKHCRKLLVFLKKWLRLCNFPKTLADRMYAIIWCAIFYLQTKDLLPSVTDIIQEQPCVKNIGDWKVCSFYNNIIINQHCDQKFSELLLGFFRYYESFDYKHFVICPLLGVKVRKEDFINANDFKGYQMPNEFRLDCAMCVQDPYNLSENITRTLDSFAVNMFRQYCGQCACILTK